MLIVCAELAAGRGRAGRRPAGVPVVRAGWGRGGMRASGWCAGVGGSGVAAAAGEVPGVCGHARAVAGRVVAAPPGRGRGDRRGARGAGGGEGHRRIAERLGVPADTVRGWLRRFARGAEPVRAHFSRWAFALDVELGPVCRPASGVADAVEAIGGRGARVRVAVRAGGCVAGRRAVDGRACCCATRVAPSRRGVSWEGPALMTRTREASGEERRREVALFRYALVRDAADPALSKASAAGWSASWPRASTSARTGAWCGSGARRWIEWIRAYRAGGYEALVPRPAGGGAAHERRVLELAFAFKREQPGPHRGADPRDHDSPPASRRRAPRTLQTHLVARGPEPPG